MVFNKYAELYSIQFIQLSSYTVSEQFMILHDQEQAIYTGHPVISGQKNLGSYDGLGM
jgi:hypothetical protein